MSREQPQADSPAPARRTAYDGPVVISVLDFGGRRFRLLRPADPDRLLDDPTVHAWNRHDDYMPYWAYLWPGALLLAEAVAREPWPSTGPDGRPLEALEIGCGIGLAGLVALGRGLRVCFSDYDPAPLEFVERNVEANGLDRSLYSTSLIDWRELPQHTYAVILGSDVLYERRLVPLVADLLARTLVPGGLGLISCPGRTSAEGFGEEVSRRGLVCEVSQLAVKSESGEPIGGLIYRIGRPESSRESIFTNKFMQK